MPLKDKVVVIPIRQRRLLSDLDREVAELAYDLWLKHAFRGGSPEETLLTAVRQIRGKPRGKPPAGLFLVPRPNFDITADGRTAEIGLKK